MVLDNEWRDLSPAPISVCLMAALGPVSWQEWAIGGLKEISEEGCVDPGPWGLDQRYRVLVGRDSLSSPSWVAGCIGFVGVTSAVLLTPPF